MEYSTTSYNLIKEKDRSREKEVKQAREGERHIEQVGGYGKLTAILQKKKKEKHPSVRLRLNTIVHFPFFLEICIFSTSSSISLFLYFPLSHSLFRRLQNSNRNDLCECHKVEWVFNIKSVLLGMSMGWNFISFSFISYHLLFFYFPKNHFLLN